MPDLPTPTERRAMLTKWTRQTLNMHLNWLQGQKRSKAKKDWLIEQIIAAEYPQPKGMKPDAR